MLCLTGDVSVRSFPTVFCGSIVANGIPIAQKLTSRHHNVLPSGSAAVRNSIKCRQHIRTKISRIRAAEHMKINPGAHACTRSSMTESLQGYNVMYYMCGWGK